MVDICYSVSVEQEWRQPSGAGLLKNQSIGCTAVSSEGHGLESNRQGTEGTCPKLNFVPKNSASVRDFIGETERDEPVQNTKEKVILFRSLIYSILSVLII